MKLTFSFSILFLLVQSLTAQNGKILAREMVDIYNNEELARRISYKDGDEQKLIDEYAYLDSVNIERITYLSDGLKVNGYLAYPKNGNDLPCVIYNRGGNRNFGALNEYKAAFILKTKWFGRRTPPKLPIHI